MVGLLPLIIALIIAESAGLAGTGRFEWPTDVWPLAASFAVWLVLTACLGVVVQRRAPWRLQLVWDQLAVVGLLSLFAWWCLALNWSRSIPGFVLVLSPILGGIIWHWRWSAPPVKPWAHVWQRCSFIMLPVLVLLGAVDVCRLLWFGVQSWGIIDPATAEWIALLAGLAAPVVLLGFMPPVLVRLWGARSLNDDRIRQRCVQAGVHVRACCRWPMRGLPFFNAAVLGLLPRYRYVLLSEDLMRQLPQVQVDAVLGHELGHAKYGHLWLYLVFLYASGLWAQLLVFALLQLVGNTPFGVDPILLSSALMVLLWIIILRIGFGIVSRACERQADLAGAELVGDPEHMAAALLSVAHGSGQDPAQPNWRHYSIVQRVQFLRQVRLDPGTATWHQRYLMRMRSFIFFLLALGLVLSLLLPRSLPNLADMREGDPRLDSAITAAADGDAAGLRHWLIQADDIQRQTYARAVMLTFASDEYFADDRKIYEQRYLLLPFKDVSPGNKGDELMVLNTLAYALSAGQAEPAAADLEWLAEIRPRLEKAARDAKASYIMDTVGCIYFRLGEREAASKAFTDALEWLPTDADESAAHHVGEQRRLHNARLLASRDSEASLPLVWGADGDIQLRLKAKAESSASE